jgi:hypothetical protein
MNFPLYYLYALPVLVVLGLVAMYLASVVIRQDEAKPAAKESE